MEPFGTADDVYPETRDALGTFVSNDVVYPSASEYKLNGPVSAPGEFNTMFTVSISIIYFNYAVTINPPPVVLLVGVPYDVT